VVSIGNLHWGGSGKTPLVAAVAEHLRDAGWRPAILSRGYGGHGRGVRVVSRGEGPLLGPEEAGDEPVLLAGELPGVAVVVAPDRHAAGLAALEMLDPPPRLFVLDDGFSHLALRRDVDLLAFPASDPFAGGRLPPGGRLREPLASAERAHALLVTGDVFRGGGRAVAEALRPYGFEGPGFDAPTLPRPPRRPDGEPLAAGERVLLVSAIANPERFAVTAAGSGLAVAGDLRFGDHHAYPRASLERIAAAFHRSGATVVLTTSKDRVKLAGRLDLPLAELPVHARPEEAFFHWLDERLAALAETAEDAEGEGG
jgi:tetraacyldisaccharide 4'-kinase